MSKLNVLKNINKIIVSSHWKGIKFGELFRTVYAKIYKKCNNIRVDWNRDSSTVIMIVSFYGYFRSSSNFSVFTETQDVFVSVCNIILRK